MKAFIPGDRTIASHDVIADMLHLEYGFVVVVYNGSRKEVLVPGKPPLDLRSLLTVVDNAPQFSEELVKLYEKEGWNQYPFAITGLTCISRGVTMQTVMQTVPSDHGGFIFNYGIILQLRLNQNPIKRWHVCSGTLGILQITSQSPSIRQRRCLRRWKNKNPLQ